MNSSFSLAVHALVFLHHKQDTLSSEEIAQNICTNPATVRKTLSKLKTAGFVDAKEGARGGYFISCPADTSLAQIAKATDVTFVSITWKSGDTDTACLISSGMGGVMDNLCEELNELCLRRLEDLTIADIEARIFNPQS